LFLALEHPAQVEGVSMLDGYLTAIVIAPRSIPPDEWFGDLCSARGNIAVASGTMLAAITSILARFNAINEGLSAKTPRHAPMFRKTDEGLAVPNLWCMGFLAGMRLQLDAWEPLLDPNRVDHGLLSPILHYCVDPSGRPKLGPPREGRETGEFLRAAYQAIPIVVPAIKEFRMPERVREVNARP
jgi:uncharacterized protein